MPVNEFERERKTRRCLDPGGAQESPPSSSEGLAVLIKQILDGNKRIETKVDVMGTRVTAVERKPNDISKRMHSTVDRM